MNAICMHEEDVGIAWKHTDFRTGGRGPPHAAAGDLDRSPPSATTSTASSGTSTRTGRSSCEFKLTGIMHTGALAEAARRPTTASLVAPGLYAPTTSTSSARASTSPSTAAQHGLRGQHRTVPPVRTTRTATPGGRPRDALAARAEGDRDLDAGERRVTGQIVNPTRAATTSASPVGLPADARREHACPSCTPAPPSPPRAASSHHHLWVTPFDASERYPAGDTPISTPAATACRVWTDGRPSDRRHRPRRLVHVGPPPRPAPRGLAGDAGRHDRLLRSSPSGFFDRTRRSTCRRQRQRATTAATTSRRRNTAEPLAPANPGRPDKCVADFGGAGVSRPRRADTRR